MMENDEADKLAARAMCAMGLHTHEDPWQYSVCKVCGWSPIVAMLNSIKNRMIERQSESTLASFR